MKDKTLETIKQIIQQEKQDKEIPIKDWVSHLANQSDPTLQKTR